MVAARAKRQTWSPEVMRDGFEVPMPLRRFSIYRRSSKDQKGKTYQVLVIAIPSVPESLQGSELEVSLSITEFGIEQATHFRMDGVVYFAVRLNPHVSINLDSMLVDPPPICLTTSHIIDKVATWLQWCTDKFTVQSPREDRRLYEVLRLIHGGYCHRFSPFNISFLSPVKYPPMMEDAIETIVPERVWSAVS